VPANSDFNYDQSQRSGFGPGLDEECICPICGFKIPHEAGTPCYYKSCPKFGMMMTTAKEVDFPNLNLDVGI
jgi:hypothetical protein